MVETRNQEKTMLELIEEIRAGQEQQTNEFRQRVDSLDDRYDKLKRLVFEHVSQLQAQGKQPFNDAGGSRMITPSPAESNRPPDPPDLPSYHQYSDGDRSRPPHNTLSNKLTKVGFPAFDGTDFRDWLCRCDQFFDLDNTDPEMKICLAAMHMSGKALQWHHNYLAEQFGTLPSWTEYVIALSSRFNGLFDDPLSDLVAMKQGTDSVEEYLDKFENARTRLSLPEAHALSIFLTNMNSHLSLHVRQFATASLSAAARIASLHESALAATPLRSYRAPFNPNQQQKSFGAQYKQQTPLLTAPETAKPLAKPTRKSLTSQMRTLKLSPHL
ncbi:Retrotransposon gag domain protein [Raphanus sativus]|nr:Retrotransposon gag domain protein [Raphanus sativus]